MLRDALMKRALWVVGGILSGKLLQDVLEGFHRVLPSSLQALEMSAQMRGHVAHLIGCGERIAD